MISRINCKQTEIKAEIGAQPDLPPTLLCFQFTRIYLFQLKSFQFSARCEWHCIEIDFSLQNIALGKGRKIETKHYQQNQNRQFLLLLLF